MNFFKWLIKDADPRTVDDRNDIITGTAAKLRQKMKDKEDSLKRGAEDWWKENKHLYLQSIIKECERLAEEGYYHYSFSINGYYFYEIKSMLREEGFKVETGSLSCYMTVSW